MRPSASVDVEVNMTPSFGPGTTGDHLNEARGGRFEIVTRLVSTSVCGGWDASVTRSFTSIDRPLGYERVTVAPPDSNVPLPSRSHSYETIWLPSPHTSEFEVKVTVSPL